MTLIDQVTECIRSAAYIEGVIRPDAQITDLPYVDSLTVFEIKLRLEEQFQVELDDADMEKGKTVRVLAEIIQQKISQIIA